MTSAHTFTAVGDAFAQPVAAFRMTRAYCQNHAAENAVAHHGWLHSITLDSAADNTLRPRPALCRKTPRNPVADHLPPPVLPPLRRPALLRRRQPRNQQS